MDKPSQKNRDTGANPANQKAGAGQHPQEREPGKTQGTISGGKNATGTQSKAEPDRRGKGGGKGGGRLPAGDSQQH